MPKIRLNKAVKEFNISMSRLTEFLGSKGFDVENNPNSQLDEKAYAALKAEFSVDSEQKRASHEVIISKVQEEKSVLETQEPEVIKAKSNLKAETRILGKIDLGASRKLGKTEARESTDHLKPKISKAKTPVEAKTHPEKNIEKNTENPSSRISEIKDNKTKTSPKSGENTNTEIERIETQYQKLDGPKILNETVDLAQFAAKPKPPSSNVKKKRKRIEKPTPNRGGNAGQGTAQQGGNARRFSQQGSDRSGKKGGRKDRTAPVELTDEQVKNQIKETLEKLTNKGGKSKASKHRKEKRIFRREREELQQELDAQDNVLKVTEFITVGELASLMNVSPTEVISACFSLGVMVTMNQRLEADILQLVADEFGYNIEFQDADLEENTEEEEEDKEEDLLPRAPIVTVMGHVDHGKTSLLDYVRKTNVIAGESGGITQHIGAYGVTLESGQRITFLDTPGHEAFTAMRARGAQSTDIVIIVIAADDEVMPQTKEAIAHAQAAGVPMIIALNKVDKPNANPDKIREQLSAMNILVEEWGGNIQSQEISAKVGTNMDLLLEKVLLQAELLNLRAKPNKKANGVVIEASLDKGRGYVSNLLVQGGSLKVGDYVLAGVHHGKVKAMLDERGNHMQEAGPSVPVTILGLDGAPTAGDKFRVYRDEKEAKNIANKREQLQREQSIRTKKHLTLDEIGRRIALGDFKELNIILKGDVDGSVEALSDMLQKLSTEEIQINILHKGVGQITESDILLATASDAIVIGFNVRAGANAKDLADKEEIEIRTYSVIYDAIDDVKEAMEGMLSPEIKEQVIGNVEIREIFKISKVGTIAGCMVLSGKVTRNSKIRLLRDGIVKHDGELESLKRFKDDVKEVTKGYECGLNLKGYNNIEVGDILEVYEEVSVKKKL
ncbi:MAG: translation initiation factor IF-2 [Bergeyella sp.]|nr:translation initiation factor IF-2 [Bergeyella sp.]